MITGVLTTSFPRRAGDFAGCFVEDWVRAAAAAGDEVEVVAAGDGAEAPDHRRDLGARIRVLRVSLPDVPRSQRLFFGAGAPEMLERGGTGTWLQALAFWSGLCEIVRRRSRFWNRVVAHWLVPSALVARALAPRLPLTAHAHSGDVALLERIPGGAALGRWLAQGLDDLVFVSEDLRRRFGALTGFRGGRVAPAVPPTRPAPFALGGPARSAARAALAIDRFCVLAVGRLVPIKGFDVLVRALALAAAGDGRLERPNPILVVLGDGPERERLQALAARLSVDLRLHGAVARAEVARFMAVADLYVQPSRPLPSGRTEGSPVATLEALAAGLPVVAAATGGLSDLASRAGVALVNAGDARTLAVAISAAIATAAISPMVCSIVPAGPTGRPDAGRTASHGA